MTEPTVRCCGRPVRRIDIGGEDGLTLLTCGVCDRRQWLRAGKPIAAQEALEVAAVLGKATRGRRSSG